MVQVDPDTVKKYSDISDRQISGYNPITVPIERHDGAFDGRLGSLTRSHYLWCLEAGRAMLHSPPAPTHLIVLPNSATSPMYLTVPEINGILRRVLYPPPICYMSSHTCPL